MALTAKEMKQRYPMPVYNYVVEVNGAAASFSKVSGLNTSNDTQTFKTSSTSGKGPQVLHFPGQATSLDITLTHGMIQDSASEFFDWINSVALNAIDKKDIIVKLMDEAGKPRVIWNVSNAFPTKVDAPEFDAESNSVAIETITLRADRLTMKKA